MKVLLTGGSGNLGQTLVPRLLDKGDTPVILDVRPPRDLKKRAVFIDGSILDRPADIVASLIRQGAAVHAFNQRTVTDIFDMIRMVGAIVGAANKADRL